MCHCCVSSSPACLVPAPAFLLGTWECGILSGLPLLRKWQKSPSVRHTEFLDYNTLRKIQKMSGPKFLGQRRQ